MSEPTCLATVVIPVFNGANDHLAETLQATLAQTLPEPYEVLAIDSGSTDNSLEILKQFATNHPNLRIVEIPNSEFSHGGTRQWAAEIANGKYIAYLSQDAVPADNEWLAKMLAGFEMGDNVGGVLGRQKPRPDCFPAQKLEIDRAFGSQGLPDKYTVFDSTFPNQKFAQFYSDVCSAAPRDLLLGPLPYRAVNYAEDQAFGIDLINGGYQKVFAGPAVVIHSNDVKLRDYSRRMYDECKGLERAGVDLGRPGIKHLAKALFKEAPYDAARAYFDKEYPLPQKLYFIATAPLYRFARWYGQLRATLGHEYYSLEAKRKVTA